MGVEGHGVTYLAMGTTCACWQSIHFADSLWDGSGLPHDNLEHFSRQLDGDSQFRWLARKRSVQLRPPALMNAVWICMPALRVNLSGNYFGF